MSTLSFSFDGFFQCRLATDPDPSAEQRGVSGFTFAVAGETLLEPSIWSQATDIQKQYGLKSPEFIDPTCKYPPFNIKNVRQASPDYTVYNERGISIQINDVQLNGQTEEILLSKLKGGLCRFENAPESNGPWKGPIFEGRNQITSDGDPDRFTINPFVFSVNTPDDKTKVLSRFDPMDFEHPNKQLYDIFPNDPVIRRLPVQRFALSNEGLAQVGIDPNNLPDHYANRAIWLQGKIVEAEAMGNTALAEAFRSRFYAVNFFTQATGPTVLANRLLSRIPLRQLYNHTIRGTASMSPKPFYNDSFLAPYRADMTKDWEILYYLGQYDGDLMVGFCSGTLSIPLLG
jgi:hypothetical protein